MSVQYNREEQAKGGSGKPMDGVESSEKSISHRQSDGKTFYQEQAVFLDNSIKKLNKSMDAIAQMREECAKVELNVSLIFSSDIMEAMESAKMEQSLCSSGMKKRRPAPMLNKITVDQAEDTPQE